MDKLDVLNRLRSAKGHVAALAGMIERDAPCGEVLRQSLAVRGALSAVNRALLRAYLLDERCGLRARYRVRRIRAWQELSAVIGGGQKH
jgi:DNA-binding FrmR family transcriptional regulator